MSEHTPGPWFVFNSWLRKDPDGTLVGPGEYSVCAMTGYHGQEKTAANARLIAAAPELLEALRGVMRVADRKTVEFDAARAAIAKAAVE